MAIVLKDKKRFIFLIFKFILYSNFECSVIAFYNVKIVAVQRERHYIFTRNSRLDDCAIYVLFSVAMLFSGRYGRPHALDEETKGQGISTGCIPSGGKGYGGSDG